MRDTIRAYIEELKRNQEKRHRTFCALAMLSVLVTGGVFWQLRLTGITMSNDACCGQEEHWHTEECIESRTLICDKEEAAEGETPEAHVHTDGCYEITYNCGLEEHTHTALCYSDPNADAETAADWENTLPDSLSGVWAEDVVAVAESQLGYTESTQNYTIQNQDERKGYTRYGAWYGNPYGDWNAMFVSFCLNYAEIPEEAVPYAAGCKAWANSLDTLGLYEFPESYLPQSGDLVFFDSSDDGSGKPLRVGIVTGCTTTRDESTGAEKTILSTIEGDCQDSVCESEYDLAESPIVGYGNLSAAHERFLTMEITETPVAAEEALAAELPNFETAAREVEAAADGAGRNAALEALDDIYLKMLGLYLTIYPEKTEENFDDYLFENCPEAYLTYIGGIGTETLVNSMEMFALDSTLTINAGWENGAFSSVSISYSNTARKKTYVVQYRDSDTAVWQNASDVSPAVANNLAVVTLSVFPERLDAGTGPDGLNRQFRVYGSDQKVSGTFSITDILESIKPGFSAWLEGDYLTGFGGTQPQNLTELYAAFDFYYNMPVVALERMLNGSELTGIEVTVTPEGAYTYQWEYQTEDGTWYALEEISSTLTVTAELRALVGDGAVRCRVLKDGQLAAVSRVTSLSMEWGEIQTYIKEINTALGLSAYPIGQGYTADLAIGGNRFMNIFYYGNVAEDSRAPFTDATSYAEYLVRLYLENGIDSVRTAWNRWLYDIYDPSVDKGAMSNYTSYPTAGTYGDATLEWPKDASKGPESSPFHSDAQPTIKDLSYDYLEHGVDYSNFVTLLEKTAQAVIPGDSNTHRLYDIDILADAQAKVTAPVALVFQIQTSWQMFDMLHANAVTGDGNTQVGAAASNTEIANLYAIKNALLRLVNYMDATYPGNNLVMAITDVEHSGSYTMFQGNDANGNPLYVTNDVDVLRNGILGWDSFGNCEHVHYTSDALENAVENLQSNLQHWKDFYGYELKYKDIRKVAVILGGATENAASTNGYQCTLPWATFQQSSLNSVYGIRTNIGTPLNTSGCLSWLDYSGNNTGEPYKDGVGTAFTRKYVAATEDAVFHQLLDIVRTEMNAQGMEINNDKVYVEHVTVDDRITDEFVLNRSQPVTATIYAKDGVTVVSQKEIDLTGAVETTGSQGETILTADEGRLAITEWPDKTTTVTYDFGSVINGQKVGLNFQVQAREDYIGSNNVFTNVGTPDLTYEHTPLDAAGNPTGPVEEYDVPCADTPEVNVPIRFSTVDGEKTTILIGDQTDLKDLSNAIVEDAEYRSELYDQIDGTLTYTWTLPDGTMQVCGSVTVKDGVVVDGVFPDRSAIFTGTEEGQYTGTLHVTFTPENTNDPNREAVNELTKPGNVWIDVLDQSSKTSLIVRKDWPQDEGENTEVQFRLLANGVPLADPDGQPAVYTLKAADGWELHFDELPAAQIKADGTAEVISYTVEELVPQGYHVTYRQESRIENSYRSQISFTLTDTEDINTGSQLYITYIYNGQTYTCSYKTTVKYEKNIPFTITDPILRELLEDGTVGAVTITGFKIGGTNKWNKLSQKDASAEKVVSGTVNIPVLVMENIPGYILPETGEIGIFPYILSGLLLMAGALVFGARRRGRGGGLNG